MPLPTVKINKSQFANFAKPTVQPVPGISKPAPGKIAIIPDALKIVQQSATFVTFEPMTINTDQVKTDSKSSSKQQQTSASQLASQYPPPKDAFKDPKMQEEGPITIILDPQSSEYRSSITFYRPEIISLTKFNPLYDEQKNQTENGVLFEALIESLRKIDVDARNFLNSSQESKNAVFKSNEELKIQLESLNSSLKQLASFIKFFTSLQNRIDVNNAFFKLKPQEFLSANFLDSNLTTYSSLSRYVSQIDKSLTLNEVLNRCLYYDGKNLDKKDNYFDHTATKCWVVSLAEMKVMINSHSRRNMKDKLSNPGAAQGYGSYPFIKVGDRITSQNLLDVGSGISPALGGGQLRFVTLQNYFSGFIDDVSAMSTILYVTLKEARQRICSTFKDEDTSLIARNQRLNSLIIDSYKNQHVFSRLNSFTGASLYDVGVFGDINSRQTPVFVLEPSSDVQNKASNGKTYFFKGFGSEDFFAQFLAAEGTADIQKINDYVLTLDSVKLPFFDFISNSGVLPIDDSKISPAFSTDVIKFFEDICSKLMDSSGEFIVTKPYIKSPGKYVGAGSRDLDALMFFGLASGASDVLKQAMSTRDVALKGKAIAAATYQLDNTQRTPEENIALMKNALYSYVLQRINEAEGSDIEYTCREIYGILTNIADVRGLGLRTSDDYSTDAVGYFRTDLDDGNENPFGTSITYAATGADDGRSSVLVAHDPDGNFSILPAQVAIAGPTTKGDPTPVHVAPEDEAVKYGIFSIQSVGTEDPMNTVLPYAIDDIKVTLAESSFVDTIIEIMRPIVSSNEISKFSLIIFDFICRLIGRLTPFKGIEVYIDDIVNDEEDAASDHAEGFTPDNEIKSALVFFIRFYALGEYNTKTAPLLFKAKIHDNLIEETNNLIRLAFSSYNIVNNLSTIFNDAKSKLLSFKTDVAELITAYLNSDPRKFALLFNDQQLSLLMSSFQDVYDSYNTFANSNVEQSQVDQVFNSYISGMCYSPKVVSILRSFFKGHEYSSIKGYNKQIMTVGIPQGLLKELNNKFKTKAESLGKLSQQKSNDIFKILIYKIDLLNDEIVYSPKEFLFEVSRFPVKTYSKISDVSNMEISSDFETLLCKLFSTRDYSIYSVKDGAQLFIESKPILSIEEAFNSADYSQFLSNVEKVSILKNHIVSFVLENYLQIISGMQFNESPFILANNFEISSLYSNIYEQSKIPQENIAKNLAVPNPNPFLQSLIHPKKFDRVFNIIFDPEFIVDESNSNKSKIEKMVNTQKLRKVEPYVGKPYYIDTDKSFIDPAFNSYFVNIETLSLD